MDHREKICRKMEKEQKWSKEDYGFPFLFAVKPNEVVWRGWSLQEGEEWSF